MKKVVFDFMGGFKDYRTSKRGPAMIWIVLRIAIGIASASAAFSPITQKTNVDWQVGVLVGTMSSVFFSYSVQVIWPRMGADFSDPWNFAKPFWPINKYPIRSWMLSAIYVEIYGCVGRARQELLGNHEYSNGSQNSVYDCLICMSTILLCTIVWWGHQLNRNSASTSK